MADIFDEAIDIVIEKGNQTWEELKVIKALKLGKLYKEKCNLLMADVWVASAYRELDKEIEVLENE